MQSQNIPTVGEWQTAVRHGELDSCLGRLYGDDTVPAQRRRYLQLLGEHERRYGSGAVRLFSAPGRTELGGNHTDHNNGLALAGAVQLDCVAAVSPGGDPTGTGIYSMDFAQEYRLDIRSTAMQPAEQGTLAGIARGVLDWCHKRDIPAVPFQATLQSDVQPGSGLSSSACIESLLTTVVDVLSANATQPPRPRLSPVEVALCGQYAENTYFGKPCGLLDQTAIAAGGVVGIDFADPHAPQVTRLEADFAAHGYRLCIVHTRSDHAADTDSYASIPREMRQIAGWFGAEVLRGVDPASFWREIARLRSEFAGRAIARAGHYFAENERVQLMQRALTSGDIPGYLNLVAASGHSSFQFLQNVVHEVDNQDYGLALLQIQSLFEFRGVVSRVHGGGFGGAVQAYVPLAVWDEFVQTMEITLGEGCVVPLAIRPWGVEEIELRSKEELI
ncbi:galactokinase [Spirochaeta africana]|uniref:Galactokinase n=1 Tax=Spirochaeta africana (strain ATCC 700263 / DSM 8902 / Z-7692) TaxID=889378 RepID=H9ULN3_SPIAZ|nr:galactokinase family protein [Spirochaeta africana]AFG38426.1 galactokinase [Spirochaeta africana DSM 8902]